MHILRPRLLRLQKLNEQGFDHMVVVLLCVVAVALVGTYALVASHANPWSGVLEMGKQGPLSSSYCLTAAGTTKGSAVVLKPCSTTQNKSQVWTLTSVGTITVGTTKNVSVFTLKSAASNLCLDNWGQSKQKAYPEKLYTCSNSDKGVQWYWGVKFTGQGYSSHQLANVGSATSKTNALCLDDQAGSKAAGTNVGQYACKKSNVSQLNQEWLEAAAPTQTTSTPPKSGTPVSTTPSSGGSSSSTTTSGGCTLSGSAAPCVGSATTAASGWGKPVFDDEFNGTALSKSWAPSWFNGGKVNNDNGVAMSPNNVSVSGGNLILTLASSSSGATIDTDPSQVSPGFQFGTGYYTEARLYVPGSGSTVYNWPAFWTDGQNWPNDGESDILEGLDTATSNYHSPKGASNSGTIAGTWSNSWHTYALDREAGKDSIYWDGKLVRSYASDDGGSPQYLILSLDCSGGCKTGASYQLKADYVRVWKK